MNKLTSNPCDRAAIDAYLQSESEDKLFEAMTGHLSHCNDCRRYLEQRAAPKEVWNEANQMLGEQPFVSEACCPENDAKDLHCHDHSVTIQTVLNSLIPSEQPQHLGRIGNYEVTGVIGCGGMGVVLKATDPSLDRVVAIKVLAPFLANSGAARKRFEREAKAAAAVLHPNVIPIHSVATAADLPYFVMAYVRGGSLQKRLDQQGPFDPDEVLRIGSQIAAGLAAAHDQGLVHRDIKPANVMLEDGVERVAITDFGLARAVDDASVTRAGFIAGTPRFMSPEQARGETVDQQSDLFSLGSVLYSLSTGRPPFRADTSYGVMRRITDEQATPIRELNPNIPEWLCAVIGKLMNKQPADRYHSAHQVSEALSMGLAHLQQPTRMPLPDSISALLTKPSRRIFHWFAGGIVLVAAIIAGIFFVSSSLFAPQQDFVPRNANAKQIGSLLAMWKEQSPGSSEGKQFANELSELLAKQLADANAQTSPGVYETWANELLPILLAGVDEQKAEFLAQLTKPFPAIRDADLAASQGKVTDPTDWHWQAVHVLAVGRSGRIGDAYNESDRLVRKISANIQRQGNDAKVDFLGTERTLPEILRECQLHRDLIEAIHGPPSKGLADQKSNSKLTKQKHVAKDHQEQDDQKEANLDEANLDNANLMKALAAIPERPSLIQADEKYIAVFELDGDKMIAKLIRDDDQTAGQLGIACWNRLTTLFPAKHRKGLVQFNVLSGRRWAGFFNGGGSNDVGRKGYSLSIAKYQALKEKEVVDPNRPLTPRRGTLDWTTVHEMGHYICLTTDAIELFSQRFDGNDKPQPTRRKSPDDYPEDGSPVLDGNFVTSYAERTPGDEEVCETFTTYLLIPELPTNDSLVAKKIRFFETLPGYPELREHIQKVGK